MQGRFIYRWSCNAPRPSPIGLGISDTMACLESITTPALCVSEHTGGIPVGHVDVCDCVCAHVLADDRELSAVQRQGFEHRSRDKLKPESVSETHPVRTRQLTAG